MIRLFFLMFIQYFLIVANTRAYTQGQYLWTAITDLLFCTIGFELMKRISVSTSKWDRVGYILGGVAGTQVSIYVTKLVYGQ